MLEMIAVRAVADIMGIVMEAITIRTQMGRATIMTGMEGRCILLRRRRLVGRPRTLWLRQVGRSED